MARVALKFMVVRHRKMTADEFLAGPEDNTKTQLIDGRLVETLLSVRHQRLLGAIAVSLHSWVEADGGLSEACIGCNFRIDDDNVFIPDVWFMRDRHEGDLLFFDHVPDLVVEIGSPDTWAYDIGCKKDAYLAGGAEVWLVDTTNDTVIVHRGEESFVVGRGGTVTTPLMPGLAIDVAALFDR